MNRQALFQLQVIPFGDSVEHCQNCFLILGFDLVRQLCWQSNSLLIHDRHEAILVELNTDFPAKRCSCTAARRRFLLTTG